MITYRQLVKSKSKTRKNLWYICGANEFLVSDALDLAKDHVYGSVDSVCCGVFIGGVDDTESIHDFYDMPYFEERKLILIYDSSKFDNVETVFNLKDPSVFFIVVDHGPPALTEALSTLLTNNQKARSVECRSATADDLVNLAVSRLSITKEAADKLVARSNGNVEWLINKVAILERVDTPEVSQKIIDIVCHDEGIPDFKESLIRFDKRQCLLYIKDKGVDALSPMDLSSSLHKLSLINTGMDQYSKQIRPISDTTGIGQKEIEKYMDSAAQYGQSTSLRCFRLLTKLYTRLRDSDTLAYYALVSGW